MSFLPDLGNVVISVLAFIAALSVIVSIHEYGHYIVGRWCGIHAEVFSVGFGPAMWSRYDKRGTKWQIAALPFGGYVKFLGDANAASAGADEGVISGLSKEERRHTMEGAPLWARAATVAAGPIFNFILAFFVFFGTNLYTGTVSEPLTIATLYDLPYENELHEGDQILAVNGIGLDDPEFMDKLDAFAGETLLNYDVLRDGREMTLVGPVFVPARVASTDPTLPARAAGVEVGDVIISVSGQSVVSFYDIIDPVTELAGAPVTMEIWRAGEVMEISVTPKQVDLPLPDGGFENRWLMGITSSYFFEPLIETPTVGRAAYNGVWEIWWRIETTFSGIYHMIVGDISTCNLSGPIGIAEISGTAAKEGLLTFISFIGVISLAVGLVNLLPIPILDGGHLVFFAYEGVTGRKLNENVLGAVMAVGMALILTLMLFATGNDILCP